MSTKTTLRDIYRASVKRHKKYKGKIEIKPKFSIKKKWDMVLAYTPGVAEIARQIGKDKSKALDYTSKSNNVAIVTDGSAVLGLGNLGPEAAIPVMEGKAMIFKEFAGINGYPICLDTQDNKEIIKTVQLLAPFFGAINLEDIAAPRCFEIERLLRAQLDIPVFHDDQHGTAVVVLAGLINALRVVGKSFKDTKIVVSGAGAAGMAITQMLIAQKPKDIIVVDSRGIIYNGRKENMNFAKKMIAGKTNRNKIRGDFNQALENADIFIGASMPNILLPEMVEKMADNPVVFALANPEPEIAPHLIAKTKVKIFATGRSDLPNQINNALAFPGIFRGALDGGAKQISERMKLAAAYAIADSIPINKLSPNHIIPGIMDKKAHKKVAQAVEKAI